MRKRRPAALRDPFHSLTTAASANNSIPPTLSGTVQSDKTATTARGETTNTTTVPIPTPSVSRNLSVWSPSLIAMPLVRWVIGAQQLRCTRGTMRMIGVMMVRTILMTTMIGRLNGND